MFYFGVDYYPEQWPVERWPIDAKLMSEAGFNVVRLAEFAWSRLESAEGRFNFGWLDRAMEILSANGMRILLGTPSASPPPWLMHAHPEIFRVNEDGRRATYGNRRNYCPNNPLYHDHCRRIVAAMAEHYAGHPAMLGWQIDNELSNRCYCPVCASGFQAWLSRRYESLDRLNEKWGTVFWSHEYRQWEEIPIPLAAGGSPNPGLGLDYYRFCSDSFVAFQQKQVQVLREKCPGHLLTHNLMGFRPEEINYFDLTRNLDVTSLTHYPRSQWSPRVEVYPAEEAIAYDTARGLRGDNFWVVEQQAGQGGWEMLSQAPRPGELRLWAYQAIARGADGILFFRWRTARFGAEQYWHGLLDHDGASSRRYTEVRRMGQELRKAGQQIAGSRVKADVAFLLSYEARFAFQIQPNHPQFSYSDHFFQLYQSFFSRNIPVDIVEAGVDPAGLPDTDGEQANDLRRYKLLVAPALHLLNQALAEKLKNYLKQGGVLMVTQRTGVKDEHNAVVSKRLPGLLAEVCGIEVEEYDSLPEDAHNYLSFALPELSAAPAPQVGVLCEVLKPVEAGCVARYQQDYYAGKPAITLNRYGNGWAVYVGTVGEASLYDPLAGWLLDLAGVKSGLPVPYGVEASVRWQGEKRLLFLMNHSDREQVVDLEAEAVNLLTGQAIPPGKVRLAQKEVLVLAEATI